MRYLYPALLCISILLGLSVISTTEKLEAFDKKLLVQEQYLQQQNIEQEERHQTHLLIQRIAYYYRQQGNPIPSKRIYTVLQAVRENIEKYHMDTPYDERDLLSIIMIESSFNPNAVGPQQEKGLFQITDVTARMFGVTDNHFAIDINTSMAARALLDKYKIHKDYKKGIIAYNGVIVREGKWVKQYWYRFEKARKAIEQVYTCSLK